MPKIRRWFHCSHDINGDPEVWMMRREIGEKSLSIWLEFLSIADRNDGFLLSRDTAASQVSVASQSLVRSVSGKCQCTASTVAKVWQFAESHLWIVSDVVPRLRNYTKYRVLREDKEIPLRNPSASPPVLSCTTTTTTTVKEEEDVQISENKEIENGLSPPALADAPPLKVKELVSLYNSHKPDECPAVDRVTKEREKKYRQYLRQFPSLTYWEVVFDELNQSLFLRGLKTSGDRPPIARDLDWLCQRGKNDMVENCQKTHEGKYRDKQPPRAPPPFTASEWYPDDKDNPLSRDPE